MKIQISIVTPCYNESANVDELYSRIVTVMKNLPYEYEHIFIDNASSDNTVERLKRLALSDSRVKIIVNVRNFGHIRSPFHAILQAGGDACIIIASDLQDPPELIPELIKKWKQGYKVVMTVRSASDEFFLMSAMRTLYYKFLHSISSVPIVRNATGAGLYDRDVIEILRASRDPYPYVRGLLSEIGYPIAEVTFHQPSRLAGASKNNFLSLYDVAMLGITTHSRVPLRFITIIGFIVASLSLMVAIIFFIAKLLFWEKFELGLAPVLIGVFFFGALQAFFVGLLGEYVGMILTQVRGKDLPLVVEKERINF